METMQKNSGIFFKKVAPVKFVIIFLKKDL